ncbi:transcription termination/antitermination protein NusG [Agrobacterium fabrum]|uniref:transcription termination/antitermination protein NusG n=1 Tax=Agrobacterium fabrum TaxID=1176649 RepID=UPI00273FF327|nr:transcription termination/antitermination protein NusG [Agrobacterium fabrum]WLP53214.1 transcription termination/antitermination protein NusG [Agrobacterium fabrum]
MPRSPTSFLPLMRDAPMMHNVKIYAASKPVNPELYDLTRFASLFDQMQNMKRLNVTMLSMAAENQPGKHEWFVVETKHKAEKTVEEGLRGAGVKVFLPLETIGEQMVRGRIIPSVSRPLLPGYVLVNMVYSPAAVCGISRLEGVAGFVGGMIQPHRVSEEEMNRFKAFGDDEALPDVTHCEQFKRGDKVRFVLGPFASFTGSILKLRKDRTVDGERVATGAVVAVDVFGKISTIEAPLALLEKL